MSDNNAFIGNLAIGLFLIELVGFLLVFFVNQNAGIPSLTKLNNLTAIMQNKLNITSTAFDTQAFSPFASSGGVWDALTSIANIFIGLFNFVYSVYLVIVNMLGVIITGIVTMVFILLVLLPSLLLTLNISVFGDIFIIGYGILLLTIVFYMYEWLMPLIMDIIKTIGSVIHI